MNDDSASSYNYGLATEFAQLGSPALVCTPNLFPELMAVIRRGDLTDWLASHDLRLSRH